MMNNNKQLTIEIEGNYLRINEIGNPLQNSCSILFHRTLRIPDDGKVYPLPPSLGQFPLCKVDDYLDKVPAEWRKTGGVFFPMHQREAMWMQFQCPNERPKAMKIAVGKVNAINGKPWSNSLEKDDYITIPKQPWLDGINAGGEGTIKQFVAMPLGSGYSVEAQVTGEEKFGGIQMIVFDSKESDRVLKFPPPPPQRAPTLPVSSEWFSGGEESCQILGGLTLEESMPSSMCATTTTNSLYSTHSASTTTSIPESFSMLDECLSCDMPCPPPASAPSYSAPTSAECFSFSAAPPPSADMFSAPMQQQQQQQASMIHHQPQRKIASQIHPMIVPKQEAKEMSLSAGGSMKQEITKDDFGLEFWDQTCSARIYVRIVNSEMYEQITGMKAPPTPITAQTYSSYGYPWFDVYNESPQNSIDQSNTLNQVKSVSQIDKDKYAWPQQDDSSIQLSASQVKSLYHNKNQVRDGDW